MLCTEKWMTMLALNDHGTVPFLSALWEPVHWRIFSGRFSHWDPVRTSRSISVSFVPIFAWTRIQTASSSASHPGHFSSYYPSIWTRPSRHWASSPLTAHSKTHSSPETRRHGWRESDWRPAFSPAPASPRRHPISTAWPNWRTNFSRYPAWLAWTRRPIWHSKCAEWEMATRLSRAWSRSVASMAEQKTCSIAPIPRWLRGVWRWDPRSRAWTVAWFPEVPGSFPCVGLEHESVLWTMRATGQSIWDSRCT